MLRFLRVFSAFRELEARLEREQTVNRAMKETLECVKHERDAIGEMLLDSRKFAEESNARNADLVERIDVARQSEVKATQVVADFVAQLKYGHKIFDHIPELPSIPAEQEAIRRARPQASDVVRQLEREFHEGLHRPQAATAV